MDYLLCIPPAGIKTRETCERIHNILATLSEQHKLNIVPDPVKTRQSACPEYYKKYRIYKEIRDIGTNGEAYLQKEEEDMILGACRTAQDKALMKSCIYAYCYPAQTVLKSFKAEANAKIGKSACNHK